jgi:glutaredoxin
MQTSISRSLLLLTAMAAAAASPAFAQYKWIGPDGRVNYSDQPPPGDAKKVLPLSGNSAEGEGQPSLPYVLQQASRNFPVVLYTSKQCDPCDRGRELLRLRGVPFSEKTVATNADQEELKKAGGSDQLPLLRVGRSAGIGFNKAEWDGLLDTAGYPTASVLPRNYKQAAAQPASGKAPPAEPQAPAPAGANNGNGNPAKP